MQKRYQIDKQRAVQQFRRLATEVNPSIQMVLPMAGIVGMLQDGVGNLMREAGLLLMMGVMDEEVRHVVGERSVQNADRRAKRARRLSSGASVGALTTRLGLATGFRTAPSRSPDYPEHPLSLMVRAIRLRDRATPQLYSLGGRSASRGHEVAMGLQASCIGLVNRRSVTLHPNCCRKVDLHSMNVVALMLL